MDERSARIVYGVLAVAATVLLAAIVWPFASALFFAAVLAGALYPLQSRLTALLRGHAQVAAGIVTLGVALCGVLPLGVVAGIAVEELIEGARFIQSTLASDGIDGLLEALPASTQQWAHRLLAYVPKADLDVISADQTGRAAAAVGTVLSATSNVVLQTVFMLILLFFLLVDGARLVAWLDRVAPLPGGELNALLAEFRIVTRSVLISSVLTAGAQTAAALIGYLLAGVPRPVFFTFVTFLFAFIPAIGAGSVSLLLALVMLGLGSTGKALFLLLWGTLVVGLSDNLLKPLLIKGGLDLHGAVVFFALVGGLAVFGPAGLLAGPLIVAFFLAVIRRARPLAATDQREDDA